MSQCRHKQPSPGTRVKNGILCTCICLQNKLCRVRVHRVQTNQSWLLSSARAWKHDGREWFVTSVRWTLIWKKRLLVILINIASHKIGVRSGWYCMKGEKRCAKLKYMWAPSIFTLPTWLHCEWSATCFFKKKWSKNEHRISFGLQQNHCCIWFERSISFILRFEKNAWVESLKLAKSGGF